MTLLETAIIARIKEEIQKQENKKMIKRNQLYMYVRYLRKEKKAQLLSRIELHIVGYDALKK